MARYVGRRVNKFRRERVLRKELIQRNSTGPYSVTEELRRVAWIPELDKDPRERGRILYLAYAIDRHKHDGSILYLARMLKVADGAYWWHTGGGKLDVKRDRSIVQAVRQYRENRTTETS